MTPNVATRMVCLWDKRTAIARKTRLPWRWDGGFDLPENGQG